MTGVYVMLTNLTSYLCKPESAMSELIKKATKEAYWKNVWEKLSTAGNVFMTTLKVSPRGTIRQLLSPHLKTFNIGFTWIPNVLKKLSQNVELFTVIGSYGCCA